MTVENPDHHGTIDIDLRVFDHPAPFLPVDVAIRCSPDFPNRQPKT